MKKITHSIIIAILAFATMLAGYEFCVYLWSLSEPTPVIRVDIFIIYPIIFVLSILTFFLSKKVKSVTKSIFILLGIVVITAAGSLFYFLESTERTEDVIKQQEKTPIEISQQQTEKTKKEKVIAKAQKTSTNKQGFLEADFGNGIVMIYVPAGSFMMGNNNITAQKAKNTYSPTPEHKVNLSAYWIAKTPTTIGQFRQFIKETNYKTDVEKDEYEGPFVYDFDEQGFLPKKGYKWDNAFKDVIKKYPEIIIDDSHPVNNISWYDAIAYTKWLSKKTGIAFSLPTEAQWEYAARGNDGRIYPWGNEKPDGTRANYADETFDKYFPNTGQSIVHKGVNDGFAITSPVGSFPKGASFVGALDMAGNLTEWVFDSEYEYTKTEKTNPKHNDNSEIKMQKGGFWAGSAGRENVNPDEIQDGHNIRSDARQGDSPHSADDHLGFRISI